MPSLLDAVGNTPLLPLRHIPRRGAPVLVKCEHLNPSGSIKDRIAVSIVEDARARGVLEPGATLIEATAGNTGIGLALVAAHHGYRLVCVMPQKMSEDKRRTLAAMGAQVIVTDDAPPSDPRNFQNVARAMAAERGWFLTDQFENPVNVAAHEHGTGPEILQQVDGRLAAFVAGAGTGGTLTGVGRCMAARGSSARLVLADPEGSVLAHWVRTGELGPDGRYAVEGIGGSVAPTNLDRSVVHEAETVSDEESFAMTRRLIREEGLFVGGSAGTAVVAALRVAERIGGDEPVVAVLPDGMDRYLSKGWLGG
ncbi:MAG: cysteine synthase family protein [Myxococcales bacterium]|nr:cysteine synthase family protein [Myxococcales bacterium]MCB9716280.1 cysteine synthase family protein [Myxococcales bacterium]